MALLKQYIHPSLRRSYRFAVGAITCGLAKFKRQFFRPALPNIADKEVNLHLGCGSIDHSKFINIDGLPAAHVHYIRSLDNLSPFKNNSVNLIYASHCLEHFSHYRTSQVIAEWFRVLKAEFVVFLFQILIS